MEAKDVAMLGFVSAASKYVDKHLGQDTNLGDLNNINIKKLKDELCSQLKFLALSDEYKKELINVGEKAFSEYAKENLAPKRNVIDELGEIFSVDFDEIDKETVENNKEIDNLLDAYNLDEKVVASSTINKPTNDDLDEFGLKADDDILLTIASGVAKSDEELAKSISRNTIVEPAGMDETFAAVLNNETRISLKESDLETNKEDKIERLKQQVKEKTVKAPIKNNASNNNNRIPLSEVLRNIGETEHVYVDERALANQTKTKENITNNPSSLKQVVKDTSIKVEETARPGDYIDVLSNPGLDIYIEKEKEDEKEFYSVAVEEEQADIAEAVINDTTLSQALTGLGNLSKKNEQKQKIFQNDPNEKIYENIMAAYPCLDKAFIKSAYKQKEEIDKEYAIKNKYILLHRIGFDDVDRLHEFVEIIMSHNYSVNVDEKKMIVDTFKELINEKGSILTNILSVANQAKLLDGEYEGYRVLNK